MSAIADSKPLEGEVILADEAIEIISILNPFDPKEFTHYPQPFRSGMTVAELLPAPLAYAEHVISVNGGVVEPEAYAQTYLKPADRVVICPVPQGGGGGKNILRMVALIAVAVFAPYAAAGLNSAMGLGLTAGTIGMSALTAGITLVGSMLVNALLPVKPVQPKIPEGMGENTTTYGIDGPKNSSSEGVAVPVCYGKHRMAGNIISLYVENVDSTQMLYMLVNAGEGPVFNLDNLELNDQPIANFNNAEWKTRMGTANQELFDWFADSFTARNLNLKIPDNGSYYLYTTPGFCEKLRFDFVCPQGIFKVNKDDGSLESYSVRVEVQYRPLGSGTWTTLESIADIASETVNNDPPPTDVTDPDPAGGGNITYQIKNATQDVTYQGPLVITDKIRSAVRRSFSSPKLTYNRYEIRIKRVTPKSTDTYISDDVYISDINEITPSKVAYNHTALVGLKIKLTDQLNGIPNLTFTNHGRIIKVWNKTLRQWGYSNSANPAWIVLDMLTHPRYGGQLPESRIDLEAFKDWADHCDDEGLEFNGVFDAALTLWDALQYVCRLGHAQIVNVGTRYSVAIERADAPVMMFGVGNIAKGSFKLNWLPMNERANEIAVTFFDRANKWKQETIKVYDPAILTSGRPQRSSAITLFGCTDELTAVREAALQLNLNKYILQTCEFETSIEALACTVGSLVYIQHDMPAWEVSGRLASGSTASTLALDRPVSFSVGQTYKALLLYPSVTVGSASINTINATEKYLNVTSVPLANFKRVLINGVERAASKTSSANYILVEDLTGVTTGQVVTYIDVDVVVEADVVNPGSEVTSVTLTAPISYGAPAQYTHWMIGPVTKVKRPFRVKTISAGSDDLKRHLSCIQYDERAYNLDTSNYHGPTGPVDPLNPGYALSHVQNLSVYEEVYLSGAQVKNRVTLAWSPPQYGIYKGADVYASINGDSMRKLNDVVGSPRYSMDADVGSKIVFKVVAFDMFDRRVAYDMAPELEYTVKGTSTQTPVPPPVTGLNIIWNGRDCKVYWRYNSRNNSYEIGSEPYGADSGALDPSILDYEVKVYHNTHANSPNQATWVYKRTEYTTNPRFIYTYEMNKEDGLKRHLKFEVRVRPKIGAPGLVATGIAYNPPPYLTGIYNKPASFETCELFYIKPDVPDFEGVVVYVSMTNPPAEIPANLAYDGPNTSIMLNRLAPVTTYYVKAAAYDTFGKTGLVFTTTQFTTTTLDINAIANGVIGVDWLDPTLRSRIDLVDGNMPGSVNARLLGEASTRQAAVLAEQTARQNADTSLASKTDTVYASLAGVGSAAAQEAILASLTANGGLASIVDALAISVDNANAAILNEQTVRAAADSASATQITTLTSTVNLKNRTFFQPSPPASDSNYTLVVDDIWIDTDASNTRYRWTGAAWDAAPESGANANRIFNADVNAPPGNLPSSPLRVNDLWIQVDTSQPGSPVVGYARWNGSAWVPSSDARLASHTTSIQQLTSTVDGLQGQWTLRIDNNGYVSGFGLASQASYDPNGRISFNSEFEVLADKFSVRMPSYPTISPFTVGTVNGLPRVIMTSALIGDAVIGNIMIADGAITNPKIAGEIKSDNYSAGVAGWKIDKNGNAEFDKLIVRGWQSGSVVVPNNGTANVVWGETRSTIPIVTLWSSEGSPNITAIDNNGMTVRLDFAGGGTVGYSFL